MKNSCSKRNFVSCGNFFIVRQRRRRKFLEVNVCFQNVNFYFTPCGDMRDEYIIFLYGGNKIKLIKETNPIFVWMVGVKTSKATPTL
jgi:hypothetical protein